MSTRQEVVVWMGRGAPSDAQECATCKGTGVGEETSTDHWVCTVCNGRGWTSEFLYTGVYKTLEHLAEEVIRNSLNYGAVVESPLKEETIRAILKAMVPEDGQTFDVATAPIITVDEQPVAMRTTHLVERRPDESDETFAPRAALSLKAVFHGQKRCFLYVIFAYPPTSDGRFHVCVRAAGLKS